MIRWENSLHVVLRQLAGLGEIGLLKLQSHLREREKVESKVSEEGKDEGTGKRICSWKMTLLCIQQPLPPL